MSLDTTSDATKDSDWPVDGELSVRVSNSTIDKPRGIQLLDLPQELLDEVIGWVMYPGAQSSVFRGLILTNKLLSTQAMARIPKMNRWVLELCGTHSDEKLTKDINSLVGRLGPSTSQVIHLILSTLVRIRR